VPEGGSYVYFRSDDASTVMVVLNQSDTVETVDLQRFEEVLEGRRSLTDALTGQPIEVSGDSLSVPAWQPWILEVK
jgi:hypothetical protein